MPTMSPSEMETFLQQPLVAALTTVRLDGSLHSAPVWFEYEDGRFYFWTDSDSVKARNLRANPEAAVCIATHREPYQYVSATGHAELVEGEILDRCLSISWRYFTEEQAAEAYVEEDLRRGKAVLIVLQPRQLLTELGA